jgi:hypothetical protein
MFPFLSMMGRKEVKKGRAEYFPSEVFFTSA